MQHNEKILVITELFLPTKGGTAVWFDSVYRLLGGKDIHIITSDVPGSKEHDAGHPNTVHRISMQRYRFLKPESLLMYLNLFFKAFWVGSFNRFNSVHAGRVLPEGLIAWLIALLTFRKFVVYAHGEEITSWKDKYKRAVLTFVYKHADHVIANSEFTRTELIKLGVDKAKIKIIFPGVDVHRFKPELQTDDLKNSLGLTQNDKLILTVGRLSRRKGFDQVIKALSQLKEKGIDSHLALIGIGEDEEYLKNIANEKGISDFVHFLGHVSEQDLPRWYNASDFFIMPNREIDGDTEGFGMVFIEANACKKPVISGLAGGTNSSVVDGVTGFRVDGNNLDEISGKIERLLQDDKLRVSLGKQGYQRVFEEFTWEKVAEKTIQL